VKLHQPSWVEREFTILTKHCSTEYQEEKKKKKDGKCSIEREKTDACSL